MSHELSSSHSYVDLPAIIGGTLLAIAISLVFTHFGSAIGLSLSDDTHWYGDAPWTGNTAIAGVIATSLWLLWTQITASMAGGYLAGRMRRPVAGAAVHERDIRDGAHGLVVWAAGTVAVALALGFAGAIAALMPETTAPAREMTDAEQNAAIIFAFMTAASSLVSAVASWWAATMGGDHRDNAVDHSRYVSFRK